MQGKELKKENVGKKLNIQFKSKGFMKDMSGKDFTERDIEIIKQLDEGWYKMQNGFSKQEQESIKYIDDLMNGLIDINDFTRDDEIARNNFKKKNDERLEKAGILGLKLSKF